MIDNIYKTKKVFKAFLSIMKDLVNCVNCQYVTFFLFDPKISDHKIKDYAHI